MPDHIESTVPEPAAALEPDSTGPRVVSETPCVGCGYNVYGLPQAGTCPECGRSVEDSLRGTWLHLCDPAWLERLKAGVTWQLLAYLAAVAGYALAVVVLLEAVGDAVAAAVVGTDVSAQGLAFAASGLGFAASLAAFAFSFWLITSPDRTFPDQSGLTCRSVCRWSAVPGNLLIGVVFGGFSLLMAVAFSRGEADLDLPVFMVTMMLLGVLSMPAMALVITGWITQFLLLRRLARRMPNESLAKQTGIVMWGAIGVVIAYLMAMVGMIALEAVASASGPGSSPADSSARLFFCPVALAAFVFFVWWVVLLFFYRARLKASEAHARAERIAPLGEDGSEPA